MIYGLTLTTPSSYSLNTDHYAIVGEVRVG